MAKNKTKKDVYYFPHDYNPTSDPKMLAFGGEFGAVGYGIYWRIIEMLHECSEHYLPLKKYIYSAIAKQMLTDVEHVLKIVESCINDFELFDSNEEYFWCNRVLRNVEKRVELIAKKVKAGEASAKARENKKKQDENSTDVKHNATRVEHNLTEGNKLNEIKLNETKLNKTKDIDNNIYIDAKKSKTENPKIVSNNDLENISKTLNISNLDYDSKKLRLTLFKENFLQLSDTEKKDFCNGHRMLLERLEQALNNFNLHLLNDKNSYPFTYSFYKEWFNTWLKGLSAAEFDIYMTRIRRD